MGAYIAQSDLEDIFGKDNIAVWSNLDGEPDADAVRIAKAIEYAEEDIENRFRGGKYALPFSPAAKVIKDWCAKLAGLWLFESRPGFKSSDEAWEGYTGMKESVNAEIDAYTGGQRALPCTLIGEIQPGAPVVV